MQYPFREQILLFYHNAQPSYSHEIVSEIDCSIHDPCSEADGQADLRIRGAKRYVNERKRAKIRSPHEKDFQERQKTPMCTPCSEADRRAKLRRRRATRYGEKRKREKQVVLQRKHLKTDKKFKQKKQYYSFNKKL